MTDRAEVTVCRDCGVPEWLNPVEDHEEWTGHPWNPAPSDDQPRDKK